MKKSFLFLAILASLFVQNSFAQEHTDHSSHTTTSNTLLLNYFGIKDALVSSNPAVAATKASEFLNTVNSSDEKMFPEGNRSALLKDAASISKTKDLKKQREYFLSFSDNMFALAKTTKLSIEPVYKAYCPMKKASWLSKEAAIKNPYYGSAMLTCGKVAETIK